MKLDGKEINEHDMYVIAVPPELSSIPVDFQVINLVPCDCCSRILIVDNDSFGLIRRGVRLICLFCAINRYPDTVAGKDPDTGQPVTLRDIIKYPNSVGGFRYKDVKDVE